MKPRMKMRATSLRSLLTVILTIAILLSGAGFLYAFSAIRTYGTEVNQTVISAHDSATPIATQSTQALQTALAQESTASATLAKFYASPNDFQAAAIQDINAYAHDSNLSIGDVNVGNGTAPTGTTTPLVTPSAHPTLTVNLKAPVSYTDLLTFISYVQNNLPKMQVAGVSIQHATGSSDTVTITSLTIEVITQ